MLGFIIAPTESAYVWKEVLQDLKHRGLEEVLLVVLMIAFLNAQFQQCCVHISRNITHKVRVTDKKEICDDFKTVYRIISKEEAIDQIAFMTDKWQKLYPRVVKSLMNPALVTFFISRYQLKEPFTQLI